MNIHIRTFRDNDAEAISTLIRRNLREVNSRDYAPDVIENLMDAFIPEEILRFSRQRKIWVAEADGAVIGTAALARDNRSKEEKYVCLTVFVQPEFQGTGVGRRLMDRIEETALARGAATLQVPASITALPFYRKRGYTILPRPESDSTELWIWMSKSLGEPEDW